MQCKMFFMGLLTILLLLQYRKRYELLQLAGMDFDADAATLVLLQYRKRYELLQQEFIREFQDKVNCYNTASGMSCCNYCQECSSEFKKLKGYNTASGMSCCNISIF